jgi:excisionase family DNA binding protein
MAFDTLTPAEASERLGIPYRTIVRWLNDGVLPGRKDADGYWRVHAGEVERRAALWKQQAALAADAKGGIAYLDDQSRQDYFAAAHELWHAARMYGEWNLPEGPTPEGIDDQELVSYLQHIAAVVHKLESAATVRRAVVELRQRAARFEREKTQDEADTIRAN